MNKCLVVSLVFSGAFAAYGQPVTSPADQLAMMRVEVSAASLVQYAAQGDRSTVELLLSSGIAASAVETIRRVTALHTASAQGQLRMVQHLIELGADVNARDWRGATPLVNATANGHLAVATLLLERRADVNWVPAMAPTALIAAIYRGNMAVLNLLLQAGADVYLPDSFGTTPKNAAKRSKRTLMLTRMGIEQ
jgi:ankyrin repeat protein